MRDDKNMVLFLLLGKTWFFENCKRIVNYKIVDSDFYLRQSLLHITSSLKKVM